MNYMDINDVNFGQNNALPEISPIRKKEATLIFELIKLESGSGKIDFVTESNIQNILISRGIYASRSRIKILTELVNFTIYNYNCTLGTSR